MSKSFKLLNIDSIPVYFSNPQTYIALDSLFEKITEVEIPLGKLKFYRIELVYATSKKRFPAKIKTMEFYMSMSPERQTPEILGELIREFQKMYFWK